MQDFIILTVNAWPALPIPSGMECTVSAPIAMPASGASESLIPPTATVAASARVAMFLSTESALPPTDYG